MVGVTRVPVQLKDDAAHDYLPALTRLALVRSTITSWSI